MLEKPLGGADLVQWIAGDIAEREAAVLFGRDAEEFGRVGAEVAVAIDVDDGPGLVLLRAHAWRVADAKHGAGGRLEFPNVERRLRD